MNNWTELNADKLKVGGCEELSGEGQREGGLSCRKCKPITAHHQHVRSCKSHSNLHFGKRVQFSSDEYHIVFTVSETIFDPAEK